MMRASSSARPRDFGGAFTPRWAPREETLSLTRGGSSPHTTGYLGSMQVWGGGPVLGQRLADRQGARHRGENRVSSHTSLHTNLPISVRTCARGTRTGSRQRGFSGVEDLTSYPEMYCQPGGVHRASVVWVLLHRVHREHLLEHL
jgi:hypothetical protein